MFAMYRIVILNKAFNIKSPNCFRAWESDPRGNPECHACCNVVWILYEGSKLPAALYSTMNHNHKTYILLRDKVSFELLLASGIYSMLLFLIAGRMCVTSVYQSLKGPWYIGHFQ